MDDHSRLRSRRAFAASADQRPGHTAGPCAVWLGAAVLTMAIGHLGIASDSTSPARRDTVSSSPQPELIINPYVATGPASDTTSTETFPGIRRNEFVALKGGPSVGTVPNNSPAVSQLSPQSGIWRPRFIRSTGRPTIGTVPNNSSVDKQPRLIRDAKPDAGVADAAPVHLPRSRSATMGGQPIVKISTPIKEASSEGPLLISANLAAERSVADSATSSDARMKQTRNHPPRGNQADGRLEQFARSTNVDPERDAPPSPPAPVGALAAESVSSPLDTAAEAMVGAGQPGDVLATLETPLSMRQGRRISEDPVDDRLAAPSPAEAHVENMFVDTLLKPFYSINPNLARPRSPAGVTSGTASNRAARGRDETVHIGATGNQLTTSTSDNPRTRTAPPTRLKQIAQDQSADNSIPELNRRSKLTNSPAAPTKATGGATLVAYQEELPAPPAPSVDVAEPAATDAGRRRDNASSALSDDSLPTSSSVNGLTAASPPTVAETESALEDSLWLQPFRMTNRNPAEANSARNVATIADRTASNQASRRREESGQLNALENQLTMKTSDQLRPRPAPPARSKQVSRNESWTISIPEMINPFTLTNSPAAPIEASGGATLVGYEEELPAPLVVDAENGAPLATDSAKGDTSEPSGLVDAEKLGEAPEDTSLQFLRESTVLLKPGESQFDIGVEYLLSESDFPIVLLSGGDVVGAEDVDFRIRELAVPMQYRFGALKRVQAFVGGAVGWSNTQVSIDEFEAFQNDGGFGDVDFGATTQLVDGNSEKPYMLATISATAPTGGDPFGTAATLAPSAPSLGQGFWSISGSALWIRTYDPLVFYYGVGGERFFSRHFEGLEIEPGTTWNYSFGVGFAVNDRVTLSTRFRGAYVEELRVDRERVLGTNFEPMSLRMAATISKSEKRLVEPFVEFGLTDGAVSNFFGITWTY